jgi:DNA polymerase-3 subunit alpha
VDPLQYGLLFERFQNAYKKDLPDIDTDFSSSGRDLVKEYCRKKYGAENCAQISNFTTYSPKSVIPGLVKSMRNVIPGLVGEGENYVKVSESIKAVIPESYEDEISGEKKKVKTLKKALSLSPDLVKFAGRCPELMEYAEKIIGLASAFSSHAAALIIADQPIVNIAPVRIDKEGVVSVQYEKQRCESLGLVKMDLLSLSTLDVIDDTIKNIQKLNPDCAIKTIEDIPLDDENTFKMIRSGQTKCVFQLGKSTMMMHLCKSLKPQNILDIAIVNALGRPSSSKEERQEFADRRFGKKAVRYLHPSLENALKETFGLGIFEEQLLLVAQDVAGWDLNKADGLRKLTKLKGKDPELAEKLEVEFIEGCMKKQNMPYETASEIWEKIVLPFAKYGFNKSHAIFYSINGYLTAYLKCNFPAEFFAAYLKQKTNDNSLSKDADISIAKVESKRMGINIVPPDINRSGISYEVLDNKTIVMGMKAIKGMGEKAVDEIFNNQPFSSFIDFIYRTDSRAINKTKVEVLAKAGCFDSMGYSRKAICEEGIKVREKLNAYLKRKEKAHQDITMALEEFPLNLSKEEWSKKDILKGEQEVLGELVSGTISDMYPGFFSGSTPPFSKLKLYPDRDELVVEFVVKAKLREFKMKTGRNAGKFMIKYSVEDLFGSEIELTVWPTEYEQAKKKMVDGIPVRAICQISDFNGQRTLMLQKIEKVYVES